MFRQGHGHVHDHGRQVHAPLPVLRRRPRPPRSARCGRTGQPRAHYRRAEAEYVVITSVDRDDLRDGGAAHFVECIRQTRALSPKTQIEVLVPDFRGRLDKALAIFKDGLPDVMNHNLETAPRLYKEARPGSDYMHSLKLLKDFKELYPSVKTKSGIMVGLGETDEEILQVMRDMREHNIDMLTIGQYLAPSNSHLPVRRYVHPDVFKMFEAEAYKMGFKHAAVGAMVRSSYHADEQAHGVLAPV